MQKQNETEIKKLQTNVVHSMLFRIYCNIFFHYISNFPKFSVNTSCEKTQGINLNYTNRLHLVLVIRIYFKDLNYPRVPATKILVR